ncbi:hypothetical protein IPJ72_04895 [Candidatus Peregrinibacteria bacterium]|nr:MAG: hypothetical protein IPJ72_04895 [Candidatus Peregrinibacteria bacterium]
MAKELSEMTTDEKLDLLIKYQRSARHWAAFRGIMSFLVFFIFIVLPLIASFYLVDYIRQNVDLDAMKVQYQEALSGFGSLKENSDRLNGLEGVDIEGLLNQIGQ